MHITSGHRCSSHCPFIAGRLCSAGGIICGGRVAFPANVFHQLQLFGTLFNGVEIRVVKSPSSSFIHIRGIERRGAAHLYWLRWESKSVECVSTCVCVCVCQKVQSIFFIPSSPGMRMDGPIMKGFNPWLGDWTITVQNCHRDARRYLTLVQRLYDGGGGR